jgi:hypothetical protein
MATTGRRICCVVRELNPALPAVEYVSDVIAVASVTSAVPEIEAE